MTPIADRADRVQARSRTARVRLASFACAAVAVTVAVTVVAPLAAAPRRGTRRHVATAAHRFLHPLGTASASSSSSSCPSSTVPQTSCVQYTISGCVGDDGSSLASLTATVKTSDPDSPTPVTCVAVLGSGANGGGFWEDGGVPARNAINALRAGGVRVLQRAWSGASGWASGTVGPRRVTCRGATLFAKLYADYHVAEQSFILSGNSGGASEIVQALGFYGAESYVDGAVPSAGPPLGRIDHGCLDAADLTWIAECATLRTCAGGNCAMVAPAPMFVDGMYPSPDCTNHTASMRTTFLVDSDASPFALNYFQRTPIRAVYGDNDCSEAPTMGVKWYNGVTSTKSRTTVAGAPHECPTHAACATQVANDILALCLTFRH